MVTLSLDASELVAVLRAARPDDRSGYDHAALHEAARVVSVIVVQELVRGAASSASPLQRRAQLDRLLSDLETADFTVDDAEVAGELSARLRQAGTPIGDLDTLIAGQALARGWTVVTRNVRHFGRVEGLPLIDWAVGPDPLSAEAIAERVKATP
jgi:tRNA(fMet)-specific endonuclease VapC